jgi:hypothetical protein
VQAEVLNDLPQIHGERQPLSVHCAFTGARDTHGPRAARQLLHGGQHAKPGHADSAGAIHAAQPKPPPAAARLDGAVPRHPPPHGHSAANGAFGAQRPAASARHPISNPPWGTLPPESHLFRNRPPPPGVRHEPVGVALGRRHRTLQGNLPQLLQVCLIFGTFALFR